MGPSAMNKATPAELCAAMRDGGFLTTCAKVEGRPHGATVPARTYTASKANSKARARLLKSCLDRISQVYGITATDERERRISGEILTRGGFIEMLVQGLDAYIGRRRGSVADVLCTLTACIAALTFDERSQRYCLASEMKERALAAGIVPRLARILGEHPSGDVQSFALVLAGTVAGGGAYPETEARREAVGTALLPAISKAMDLSPHSPAVQHYAISSVVAVLCSGGKSCRAASRADLAIRAGVHTSIVEAMRRHGHLYAKSGLMQYYLELEDGRHTEVTAPSSILLSGCSALSSLVGGHFNDGGDIAARSRAVRDCGALQVVAGAIRANPAYRSFDGAQSCDARTHGTLPQMILTLLGDDDLGDVVGATDAATLNNYMQACYERMMMEGHLDGFGPSERTIFMS